MMFSEIPLDFQNAVAEQEQLRFIIIFIFYYTKVSESIVRIELKIERDCSRAQTVKSNRCARSRGNEVTAYILSF